MNAFTPGPWRIAPRQSDDDPGGVVGFRIMADGLPLSLADVWGAVRPKQGDAVLPSVEEAEANARLISAAPDTLVYLERTLKALKWCAQWLKGNDLAHTEQDIVAASAAIARAKGEAE